MILVSLIDRIPGMQLRRKGPIVLRRMTIRKLSNLVLRIAAFAFKSPSMPGLPVLIKIDVAPQCQLRCPVCPHSSAGVDPDFHPPPIMRVEVFEKIVDDVAGRTMAMALYNLGEPLLHPHIIRMIRYAEERGINTYITTNLSLPLKDARITELIDSGISMIIVAVDGISEATFGQQRVGGKWDLIQDNIRRLGEAKSRRQRNGPHLVLQFLTFDFNAHETVTARKFASDAGFDDVHFVRGDTTPWKERRALKMGVEQKRAGLLPHCVWPYFSMSVSSSGQVSPCCISRMDDYHRRSAVPRSMGNALEEKISSIYANAAYKSARRLSANPTRHVKEASGHFCEGCGDLRVK